MEPVSAKPSFLRNALVRLLAFGVFVIVVRFAYVVTVTGESCSTDDFCFFSLRDNLNLVIAGAGAGASAIIGSDVVVSRPDAGGDLYTSKDWINAVHFYSSVFQDLLAEGYLSPGAKSLCLETPTGVEVFALKEIGVADSIGISKKASKPLVVKGEGHRIPFDDNSIDFAFSGAGSLENSSRPSDFAAEVSRILRPEGFLVVHLRATDTYSFNSFFDLFNYFKIVKMHNIQWIDSSIPYVREIVMRREREIHIHGDRHSEGIKCSSVPVHKRELVGKAEPLIMEEPQKPWITLKRNINNIKYLSSMVDISFKSRYVYVDVGARSYGSSIGSWFRKQYPKQNKTFHVYAIEADKTFHEQYRLKKGVTLLPYAAWIKNETLSFEINHDPGAEEALNDKGRGMGRIQPAKARGGGRFKGVVDEIQGFDFAEWLKHTVTERDFVVMKMDVEGTEFDLIPRLFETGAICLIDEVFLECHYNRWQRCCPGQRSAKYEKTYQQCLDLFTSLRERGVLVHQWW